MLLGGNKSFCFVKMVLHKRLLKMNSGWLPLLGEPSSDTIKSSVTFFSPSLLNTPSACKKLGVVKLSMVSSKQNWMIWSTLMLLLAEAFASAVVAALTVMSVMVGVRVLC